jgi:hypothetical protein
MFFLTLESFWNLIKQIFISKNIIIFILSIHVAAMHPLIKTKILSFLNYSRNTSFYILNGLIEIWRQ